MFTFTVTPDDGEPFRVTAGSRDVYTWEKTSKEQKTIARLYEDMSMVDLYAIAHIASRRLGLYHGDLKEFTSSCELETEEEEADSATPFPPDPSPETASPSPSTPASRRKSGPKKANARS